MNVLRRVSLTCPMVVGLAIVLSQSMGCGRGYRQLRMDGQEAMTAGDYGPARTFFEWADQRRPQMAENLHDLGECSLMLARQQITWGDRAAAHRELERAIAYYDRAISTQPSHHGAIKGKMATLELQGQFDDARRQEQWAAEFVGPSATQEIRLAHEHEQSGEYDLALSRFKQAVAMEPSSADVHIAFARFLLRRDREQPAIAHFLMAYRIDPSDRRAAEALAQRNALPSAMTTASPTP